MTDPLIDPLDAIYAKLIKNRKQTVRDLDPDARRAYQRKAMRQHRHKLKHAQENGSPEPTAAMIRDALADAALALLATGGPGSDQVKLVLGRIFSERPGVAGTVAAKAKAGTIRPKLLR